MSTGPKSASPLRGRVALLTGSARGVGKGVAEVLAGAGVRLALNAYTPLSGEKTGSELSRRFGVEVLPVPGDMADAALAAQVG